MAGTRTSLAYSPDPAVDRVARLLSLALLALVGTRVAGWAQGRRARA